MTLLERITVNPARCGVQPCIRGMRIRVSDVLDLLGAGVEVDEILRDYPDFQFEDIDAAVHWATLQTP